MRGRFLISVHAHRAGVWAGRCGIGMLDATRALQAAGPPLVVTAPASMTVAAGATASFTVEAIGVVTYQWTRRRGHRRRDRPVLHDAAAGSCR